MGPLDSEKNPGQAGQPVQHPVQPIGEPNQSKASTGRGVTVSARSRTMSSSHLEDSFQWTDRMGSPGRYSRRS